MQIRDSELRKRKVITADGMHIGQAAGLEFDTGSLLVTTIFVRVTSELAEELGVKRPLLGRGEIAVSAKNISAVGDAIVLTTSLRDLHTRAE